MDITVLPISVNEHGELSLLVVPARDALHFKLTSFSHPQLPDDKTIFDHLPEILTANGDQTKFVIKTVPHPSETKALYIVAGNEDDDVFRSPSYKTGRWVEQDDLRFGPLPEKVNETTKLAEFYTGSLDRESRIGILSGIHTLRAIRAGRFLPGEVGLAIAAFPMIAENPQQMSRIMSPTVDSFLPSLNNREGTLDSRSWERYLETIGRFATTNIRDLVQARSQSPNEETPKRPIPRKTKGAGATQRLRATGRVAKPA